MAVLVEDRPRLEAVRPAWLVVLDLAALVPGSRWIMAVLVGLGFAAAIAETLQVGLAVLFLFAILGDDAALASTGGPLVRILDLFGIDAGSGSGWLAATLVVLILLGAALIYVHEAMSAIMNGRVAEWLRDLVHEQYLTVSYHWLQQQDQGALINTLAEETWIVADAFNSVTRTAANLCAVIVFGAGLLMLSWQIALTATIAAVVTFLFMRLLARPVQKLGVATLQENEVLAERMLVSLHGMRTLRAFAQEDFMIRVYAMASSTVRRLGTRTELLKALIRPISEVSSLLTLVVIALVAGAAGIGVATIVTAALLLFRLQPHLREIDRNRLALDSMTASVGNVRAMLAPEGKIWPRQGTLPFPGLVHEIRFEAVSFHHDDRRPPSVDNANFCIRRGTVTALSGPSGSGKSTIINLLLRLYDPDSGRISVDGRDLGDYDRASWLARIAVAGQDVELIEGSVAQNIRLARHDATMDDLRTVCALVEILDDIEAIPEDFDARVGPGGLSFSGGQRQRIGIARALIRQPELLILDEAMSALEPALEERIKQRIFAMMQGKTILSVSHRRDALKTADAVVTIAGGKIYAAPATAVGQ
jgi:ABC-type multidrug transport system fused ATPase/permease subunit